jgi:hypothetical protein
MKKWILITLMVCIPAAASFVRATENPSTDSAKMQNIIYGATIDSKAAFYQKRIYLVDSEFKILADIGRDAVKKIEFLKAHRQSLIRNMIIKNVKFNKSSMDSFLGTRIHNISASMEAYSIEK